MTTVQRGGGPRSLGASLLDQVLAETLDPAYAQAALVVAVTGLVGLMRFIALRWLFRPRATTTA